MAFTTSRGNVLFFLNYTTYYFFWSGSCMVGILCRDGVGGKSEKLSVALSSQIRAGHQAILPDGSHGQRWCTQHRWRGGDQYTGEHFWIVWFLYVSLICSFAIWNVWQRHLKFPKFDLNTTYCTVTWLMIVSPAHQEGAGCSPAGASAKKRQPCLYLILQFLG